MLGLYSMLGGENKAEAVFLIISLYFLCCDKRKNMSKYNILLFGTLSYKLYF